MVGWTKQAKHGQSIDVTISLLHTPVIHAPTYLPSRAVPAGAARTAGWPPAAWPGRRGHRWIFPTAGAGGPPPVVCVIHTVRKGHACEETLRRTHATGWVMLAIEHALLLPCSVDTHLKTHTPTPTKNNALRPRYRRRSPVRAATRAAPPPRSRQWARAPPLAALRPRPRCFPATAPPAAAA